jgi:hypothetical protein
MNGFPELSVRAERAEALVVRPFDTLRASVVKIQRNLFIATYDKKLKKFLRSFLTHSG